MGGCSFETFGKGETVDEAFAEARERAQYNHGHGGYSGTIAEKQSCILFTLKELGVERKREESVYGQDQGPPRRAWSYVPTCRPVGEAVI